MVESGRFSLEHGCDSVHRVTSLDNYKCSSIHVYSATRGDGMSGSSGGGNWVNEPSDDCAKLSGVTTLNSPDKDVLKTIKKNDELEIRARQSGKSVVIEAIHNGKVAGTITSSIIQRLAECMEKGFKYVADVIEDVKGGACKVRVHNK
jgi:hypothetical protein